MHKSMFTLKNCMNGLNILHTDHTKFFDALRPMEKGFKKYFTLLFFFLKYNEICTHNSSV